MKGHLHAGVPLHNGTSGVQKLPDFKFEVQHRRVSESLFIALLRGEVSESLSWSLVELVGVAEEGLPRGMATR